MTPTLLPRHVGPDADTVTDAAAAPAGWYADPVAPRRARWWDGRAWSSEVAGDGWPADGAAGAPVGAEAGGAGEVVTGEGGVGVAPAAPPEPRRSSPVVAGIAAALASVAFVAGLVAVVAGAPPARSCLTASATVEGEVAAGTSDSWCVELPAGTAARVRLVPTGGDDLVVGLALPQAVARDEFFAVPTSTRAEGAPDPDLLLPGGRAEIRGEGDVGRVVAVADERAAGEPERAVQAPLPLDGELTVLVAGFEGVGGGYALEVELLGRAPAFDPAEYPDVLTYEERFPRSAAYDHYRRFLEGEPPG